MRNVSPRYQRVNLHHQFELDGRKVLFQELVFSKNNISISNHVHSFFETVYFVSGEGDYLLYDKEDRRKVIKEIRYTPGTLIETSPGTIHGYNPSGNYELIYWKWVLASSTTTYPSGLFSSENAFNTISPLLQVLEHELGHYLPNRQRAWQMLVELLSRHSYYLLHGEPVEPRSLNPLPDMLEPNISSELVRFIEDNFHLPIQLEDLADQFHKSTRQISRILLDHDPPVRFKARLDQLRVSTAKQLLLQTREMKLREIATRVGYNDEYHFGKVFKRLVGISPGKYRNDHGL